MPSASTVFVDTNVLLYAVDPRDPGKQAAAQSWLNHCWVSGLGRLSTQVLHEMYANLRRVAVGLSAADARRLVREYRAWGAHEVDDDTVDMAWEVQDRFGFHYWDALMVASAQQQGCSLLVTEDLQHDQRIDGLRIVNPFLAGPELLET
jgi:predicted nucleic acid-binding protein